MLAVKGMLHHNHKLWRSCRNLSSSNLLFSRSCVESARKLNLDRDYKEGSEVEGFLVTKVCQIPEFSLTAIRLRHEKTGAQYLHLARDDSNNAFCVGFRTTPTDSTGLPHILEHTTLCGSQKFPCRDPFFKMLNRSMATFMNAMTGPDYTIYPFSTQNQTDYQNLMSVYLDAVFKPQLRESDFRQEGWRLEHADVNDQSSPIIIKGVVFNEMKGALSENQNLFFEHLMNNILPSNTYGFISGGDPLVIPSLTYADLKNFHKKYYHPSNARFYSYGNFPLIEHLRFINKSYLQDFNDMVDFSKTSEVPSEPRWDSERRKHVVCKNDPLAPNPAKQSSIVVANLCCDIRNNSQTFVMNILSELMTKGPNSAFYKSLIEPSIGAGFSPVTGYESHLKDTFFAVGLQGVEPSNFDRIVEIYHKTIDQVIDEGFDDNNINAILHNIELSVKHQSSDFGLSLLFGLSPLWNHNGDIIQSLKVNHQVEKLKKSILDNPLYLQDRVQEYFKDNDHRLILSMSPEEGFEENLKRQGEEILKEKLLLLQPKDKDHLYLQGIQLAKEQEAKQDLSCLPTLHVSDLSKEVERTLLDGYLMQGVPVQVCTAPTNGIVYFRGVLNADLLSEDAKNLLPLFCYVLPKMGTEPHDYRQFDQLVRLKTGGLNLDTHVSQNIFDPHSFEEGVYFSSYCLVKNVKAMFTLWEGIFNSIDFSNERRFDTLSKMLAANLANGICDSGHEYAISSASSSVSPSAKVKESFGGLTFVHNMKKLTVSSDTSSILELMKGIGKTILLKKHIRTSLNIFPGVEDKVFSCMDSFLGKLKGNFEAPFVLTKANLPSSTSTHHIFNFPINHTAMSFPTVEYTHRDFPSLRVLARLLTSKYLLSRVREKGGAYGSGARIASDGTFSFFSYRDPKSLETFDVFDAAQDWVSKGGFTEQDVEEAKLGVFQGLDAPIPPGARGSRNFLYGISDDELQKQRLGVMTANRDDIIRAASYLSTPTKGRVILGPRNPDILQRTDHKWQTVVCDV